MNYAPDSTWSLDPREKSQLNSGPPVPLGLGNQVSVEFNLIYRWVCYSTAGPGAEVKSC